MEWYQAENAGDSNIEHLRLATTMIGTITINQCLLSYALCCDSQLILCLTWASLFTFVITQEFSIGGIVRFFNVVISKVLQKLVQSFACYAVVLLDTNKHSAKIITIVSVMEQ